MPEISETQANIAVFPDLEDKIYSIRGQRVMLDRDLAGVYQVETRVLNQAVHRNLNRFPTDFIFQLTKDEVDALISQTVTSKRGRGGTRKLPFAFTEHGAVMLASVLNSSSAVQASIIVVRAFVKMRTLLALHQDLATRVNDLEKITVHHDQKFGVVSQLLSEILRDPKYLKKKIGFVEEQSSKRKK